MLCRTSDLRFKDVVCSADGTRLGYVGDVELDTDSASLSAIIIKGRFRFFGLLGREDDIVIPWEKIDVIGEDTILVSFSPRLKR